MRLAVILFMLIFNLGAHAKPAQFVTGKVISVSDGDTATILDNRKKKTVIRFYGIDSPEKEWKGKWPAQPYSNAAKKYLSSLILGKVVAVRLNGDTTKKRLVGEVFANGYSVNREMMRAGLAWWNKKYEPNDTDLMMLERVARKNRVGLWQHQNPTPPWVHRSRYK